MTRREKKLSTTVLFVFFIKPVQIQFPLNIKQALLLKSFCKRTLYLCYRWSEECTIRAFPSHSISFDFPLIASNSQELELFSIFQEGSSYQETSVFLTRLKICLIAQFSYNIPQDTFKKDLAVNNKLYYIHFEITCDTCNLIGSQQCDLFTNHAYFSVLNHVCSKSRQLCSKLHHFRFQSCHFRSILHHFCFRYKSLSD